ncbi:type II toxin-antitoxin system PemK/MazF family toxin [Rhodobacteraceae bacterium N5(2021)]|uniref:Type II toxin-antitoxin system PemK/MazF family toxin n=1 Tax=Gymnodinialimonas phycosphaerae TaxID=2841589 RepID=A0A975TTK0_9RHOB|nr:type II toxin-antitoxin system PemK/MazF family toxin [Gymnodinialimonas phycosphaerae]MBY4894530.1 type II toxin-antitoxin system PemK/MazF family toxin [Gymnodinialimonas phycosphaerae]
MPLKFHPRAGALLVADFRGFEPPEICKRRPVVVVSPRLPNRGDLVAVVPTSTTAPIKQLPYHVKLSQNYAPWDAPDDGVWAKCDLLMNISLKRMDGFKVGKRKWITPAISAADLENVRAGVLAALGFGSH